ncbi:MAG: SH3 domain-containing protein [Alphaproteobacteria bacterium HGW-Alphaproteobacteria-1]|jgi:hypothetical protein|nr:MAG: SH3 domain-containing protein [Alphaproteobacteria bacterium HGW-Alphaproteobacteria-1]
MWRFILISFVFLGWAFYTMSGGADYTPAANSIQARALLSEHRPKARPLRENVIQIAQAPSVVSRVATSLEQVGTGGAQVVLASVEARPVDPRIVVPTVVARSVVPPEGVMVETVAPVAAPAAPERAEDRRRVSGHSVNLRTGPGRDYGRLGSLARGTEVIVLDDSRVGWVKLRVVDTGRIGWMAAPLLVATN